MNIVAKLIEEFDPKHPTFRPTEIYNEGWLLRCLLHQFSTAEVSNFPLTFYSDSSWFSEAILPTAFKARKRGDKFAEKGTNADGVIGHFRRRDRTKAGFELISSAKQFVVIEAKINSSLSSRIKNAENFDQAARSVACMAEVLKRANIAPDKIEQLAFIVLAPKSSIDSGKFTMEMKEKSIRNKVKKRIYDYNGDLDDWYQKYFEPTLEVIDLQTLSWEKAIEVLCTKNSDAADELLDFFKRCSQFNSALTKTSPKA
jgi:hypothetical protein